MLQSTKLSQPYFLLLYYLQHLKKSVFAFLFCLPTSLLALLLLFLLACNGFSIFCVHVHFPDKPSPEPAILSPENVTRESRYSSPSSSSPKVSSSSVMYAVIEDSPPAILKARLSLLPKNGFSIIPISNSSIYRPKRMRKRKILFKILRSEARSKRFSTRVRGLFENSKCEVRFFMTWISSLRSFGDRELFALESVFKSHPNACLVIVSNSMDSSKGSEILMPFLSKGFRIMAISPDFDYLFKNTNAESWFNRLRKGNVDPGEVSLGQNLSNLVRLALLYKFGGIYIDTDVIVLKSLSKLRNSIGAQTIDLQTGNWSRLNNAVLIFDKNHPLLFKFIEEFALTFNGNKWGHNGPYLVSRVVSRLNGRPGFNFTVLPPSAFYPVDWRRVQSLFSGRRDELHSKWLLTKLRHIRHRSYVVHLWNKQSRKIKVEAGSVISHIISDSCIFCNSSS